MPTFGEFCERVNERLGLDPSYLEDDIPSSINRYIKRLLRDYNFPKSVRKAAYSELNAGSQSYRLPDDFKTDLQVVFREAEADGNDAYSDPLRRRESFTRPEADGVPRFYWIEGQMLWTDVTLGGDSEDTSLIVVYQSLDPLFNQPWMLAELEDVLFSLSVYRLACELSKPELAQVWAQLWAEDQRSLAIYQNELQFHNLDIQMRSANQVSKERYPR